VQAVCKGAKTLALTKDGAVYSWGTCDNNSLGHGAGVRVVHRPKRIEALEGIKIVQVRPPQRCGAGAACAGCG
jgi:alpha-tubulin suppressor-like RCC1 family protein